MNVTDLEHELADEFGRRCFALADSHLCKCVAERMVEDCEIDEAAIILKGLDKFQEWIELTHDKNDYSGSGSLSLEVERYKFFDDYYWCVYMIAGDL